MNKEKYKKHTIREISENLPVNMNRECMQAYASDLCRNEPWAYATGPGVSTYGQLPETIIEARLREPDPLKKAALQIVHKEVVRLYAQSYANFILKKVDAAVIAP